jgi:plastocyanin
VAIYADAAAEHAHFVGQTTIGSATIEYHVASLPQGTYLFRCDIHPRDMAGALVVGAASGE